MGEVAIRLNGHTYRFECGEGEEARIEALGSYVSSKMDQLGPVRGRAGADQLLVMVALLLADEVFEARDQGIASAPTGSIPKQKKPGAA